MTDDLALETTDLHKSVRIPGGDVLRLLDGVSLRVAAGDVVAIMGRSGSGKSTLLSCIGLLSPADRGNLSIAGVDATGLSDRRRAHLRNARIGFVFQAYSLVHHLNAAENVALPLLHGSRCTRDERRRRVAASLAAVGLTDRTRSRPRHLSGGEQQRVAIARALVRRPAVLIADEPTVALDTNTAESVWDALRDASRETSTALIIATHDHTVAARADRTYQLVDGA